MYTDEPEVGLDVMEGRQMAELSDLRIVANGLDHPEGIALGKDGMLYAGGEAGQLYRIDPKTSGLEQIATSTNGFMLGIFLDGKNRIYACDAGNRAIVRFDPTSGTFDRYCESAAGAALVTPNWAAFAPDGSTYLSDSGTEALDVKDGRLLRIPPGGGDADVIDLPPLHFPNGLTVSPDGTVYLLESFTPRLRVLRDGGLETVVDLPGVVPDGLALAADGSFLIGCYYPFRILHVSVGGGSVDVVVDDPTGIHIPMPTNLAFFGSEMRNMAIAALGGYAIKSLYMPFKGAALHYPSI